MEPARMVRVRAESEALTLGVRSTSPLFTKTVTATAHDLALRHLHQELSNVPDLTR